MDEQIKRLADLDIENILLPNDPHYNLGVLSKSLDLLKQGAKKLIEYPDYWEELPSPVQELIVNECRTIMRVIDEIAGTKENAEWLSANLEDRKRSIVALYDRLYPYLVIGVRQYENNLDSARKQVKELISEIKSTQKSVDDASEKAESAASFAQDAANIAATVKLSEYFDTLANGDQVEIKALKKDHKKTWLIRSIFTSGYKMASVRWLMSILFFIVLTGGIAIWAIDDLQNVKLEQVLAKALILAAPAYGIKFSARNYRENKSLQAANNHRAVVMKTLLAFMARDTIDVPTKNIIITEAASQAFKLSSYDGATNTEGETVLEFPSIKVK